jgi:hypothetical protein
LPASECSQKSQSLSLKMPVEPRGLARGTT